MSENNAPKKKRPAIFKMLITLGVVSFLILSPIAALYIAFYDGSARTIEPDPSFNVETFLKEKAVMALDTTKDDGQVAIRVSENDFNQLIVNASDTLTSSFPQVKSLYTGANMRTGDDQYIFYVNGQITRFFKTRVKLVTSLSTEDINGEECIAFEVKDIKMGRVSFLKTFKKNKLVRRVVNDEFIDSFLSSTGFSIKSDIDANNRIYYPKSAISKDMALFSDGLGSDTLYNALIQEYVHQNMFDMDFNKNGFVGGINLVPAHTNDAFVSLEKHNTVDFDSLRDKVKYLLDNSDLTTDYANLLYKFFISGFNGLTEEEQNKISELDLSSVGVSDVHSYDGIFVDYTGEETVEGKIVRPQVRINEYMQTQIDASECDNGDQIATLPESELNKTLGSSQAIGTPYVFTYKMSDGKHKVNTFTVNNLYTNIYNGAIKLTINLSVNGYDTYICMNNVHEPNNSLKMKFDVSDVSYGEKECTPEFRDQILALIFNAFESDQIVSLDKENSKLVVDISSLLSDAKKTKIESEGGVDQIISGNTKDENGSITFKVVD